MPPQPPPSQAGKFKPRKKPAKKIRVGEAAGAAAEAPPEASAPAPAPAPSSTRGGADSSVRGGRGGRAPAGGGGRGGGRPAGRGGGGRSGGGGRGGAAAHAPLEQGQAFFQAAAPPPPPPAGHSSRRSNAAASASSGVGLGPSAGALNRTAAATRSATRRASSTAAAAWGGDVQEEIIGILDEGVGAAAAATAPSDDKKRNARAGSTGDAGGDGTASGSSSTARRRKGSHAAVPEASIYYDDDSSDESEHGQEHLSSNLRSERPQNESTDRLLPMALPETRRPASMLSAEGPETVPSHGGPVDASVGGGGGVFEENPLLALTSKLQGATLKGSGTTAMQGGRGEDWLLVQLPTRLPPLKRADSPPTITSSVVGAGGDVVLPLPEATPSVAHPAQFVWPTTADSRGTLVSDDGPVSVPSIMADRFDHDALRTAQPGRLGRLVVYKSGAMHLLLEGPDGTPTIRMNVTGRECGLVQQAVSVDPDARNLVMLGNVQHSLVVTPDLTVD